MKHPSVLELYNYWNKRRGQRAAPERSDIEPGAIRRALADAFVIAFDANAGHPFRIAGTRLCAAFGREVRGAAFMDLWNADSRRMVRELLAVVAQESIGVVAGARGTTGEGSELEFELLALPLRYHAATDARILGALAPAEVPYWFGVSRIGHLSLGSVRYLRADSGATVRPGVRRANPSPAGRIRHGFVVHDGGQA